jgi:uncharacterized membrane protein
MEDLLGYLATYVALAMETVAVIIVAYGGIEALFHTLAPLTGRPSPRGSHKHIWVRFGSWLLLALQFALAGDIVRSAIAPTWPDIGRLAAIAAIRTFLNFFLERDLESLSASRKDEGQQPVAN